MATRIRLQRHGKKNKPFYHIVIADSRVKRDGRIIERIGSYNPNINPALIDIDFERALHWVKVGAQPSDTMRAMLKYRGVLLKDHLDRGVVKGAHTQEQADAKFDKWVAEKENKIQGKKDGLDKAEADKNKVAFAAEKAINDAKAKEVQDKNAALATEVAAAEAPQETEVPTTVGATTEAAPTAEAPKAEATEEKAAE